MHPKPSLIREIQATIRNEASHQDSSILSPPPAYTSERRLFMRRPLPTTAMSQTSFDDNDDSDASEGISPISLRINTSVIITKSNNLVCLSETPAEHANAIARAVVQAIYDNSSGQCGIPMIDEDGRPRPVNIEVDAGITVEGAGNIVGKEDFVKHVLSNWLPGDDSGSLGPSSSKRRYSRENHDS